MEGRSSPKNSPSKEIKPRAFKIIIVGAPCVGVSTLLAKFLGNDEALHADGPQRKPACFVQIIEINHEKIELHFSMYPNQIYSSKSEELSYLSDANVVIYVADASRLKTLPHLNKYREKIKIHTENSSLIEFLVLNDNENLNRFISHERLKREAEKLTIPEENIYDISATDNYDVNRLFQDVVKKIHTPKTQQKTTEENDMHSAHPTQWKRLRAHTLWFTKNLPTASTHVFSSFTKNKH